MGAVIFSIKTIIITALVIAILQIRLDGEKLETKISRVATETGLLNVADKIADGAIKLAADTWEKAVAEADGQREGFVDTAELGFNQSEVYMAKKSESAQRAIRKFRKEIDQKFKGQKEESRIQEEDLGSDH